MKNRKSQFLVLVLIIAGVCAAHLLGQTPPLGGKVADAFMQLKEGKPQQAQELVATIAEGDPDYPAAQCCKALCLYDRKDTLGFLKAMKSPVIEQAELPAAIRDELNLKHLEALFQYRKFEEILPRMEAIQASSTDPDSLIAVHEFQMATLYERGMKKLTESGFLRSRGDVAGAEKRSGEGQENLGQYLRLSADVPWDGYRALTNRDAQTEVVKALTALGGEQEVLNMATPAEREETALAILQLSIRTKPEAAGQNLQRMTNFLNEFPNNKRAPRLRYEMAIAAFEKGWQLQFFDRRNHTRGAATPYFDKARELFSSVVVDKEAGVADADVMECRKGVMRIYYAKQDWSALSNCVVQSLATLPVGGKDWLAFKLYDAAGLACQWKSEEAANELEELLAIGFKGNPSYDGLLVSAAKWRVRVAKQTGDSATIQRMAELVEKSECYGSLKRTFPRDFKEIVAQSNPLAK